MKKLLNYLYILLLAFVFTGCSNFLQGKDIAKTLNETVNYMNSPECLVNVKPVENTGMIIMGAGENKLHPTDVITVEFQVFSDYNFGYWHAVSKDDKSRSMDEYVRIYKPASLTTKVELLKECKEEILIEPVCYELLQVSVYPKDDEKFYPCSSNIKLTFNKPLGNEKLSGISVNIPGVSDWKQYYETPVYQKIDGVEDRSVIIIQSKRAIPVTEVSKTITVSVPGDLYYTPEENAYVSLETTQKYSFLINSTTETKAEVKLCIDDDSYGILKYQAETITSKNLTCNLGQGLELSFTPSENYEFKGWNISNPDLVQVTSASDSYTKKETLSVKIMNPTLTDEVLCIKPVVVKIPAANISFKLQNQNTEAGVLKLNEKIICADGSTYSNLFKVGEEIELSYKLSGLYNFTGWYCSDASAISLSYKEQYADTLGYDSSTQTATVTIKINAIQEQNIEIYPEYTTLATVPVKFNLTAPDGNIPGVFKVNDVTIADGYSIIVKENSPLQISFVPSSEKYKLNNINIENTTGAIIFNNFTFDATDSKYEGNINVFSTVQEVVNISLDIFQYDECEILLKSSKGTIIPSGVSTYYSSSPSTTVYFTPNSDYGFSYYSVICDGKLLSMEEAAEYIEFDDVKSMNTSFKLKKAPVSGKLTIEPVCGICATVLSKSPSNPAETVNKDSRITVVFNKNMDESSIYYSSEDEVPEHDENGLLKDKGKIYGYIKDGLIYYKNIKVTNFANNKNVLENFDPPKIEGNVLTISTKTSNNNLDNMNVYVELSNQFCYKVDATNVINLSAGVRWMYVTNESTDNVPPTMNITSVKAVNFNSEEANVSTTKIQNLDIETVKSLYVNDNSLNLSITVTDTENGTGPAETMTAYCTRLYDENYRCLYGDESEIDSLTAIPVPINLIPKSPSVSVAKTLSLDSLQDGVYKIVFTAYDKVGNPSNSSTDAYYIVKDSSAETDVETKFTFLASTKKLNASVIVSNNAAIDLIQSFKFRIKEHPEVVEIFDDASSVYNSTVKSYIPEVEFTYESNSEKKMQPTDKYVLTIVDVFGHEYEIESSDSLYGFYFADKTWSNSYYCDGMLNNTGIDYSGKQIIGIIIDVDVDYIKILSLKQYIVEYTIEKNVKIIKTIEEARNDISHSVGYYRWIVQNYYDNDMVENVNRVYEIYKNAEGNSIIGMDKIEMGEVYCLENQHEFKNEESKPSCSYQVAGDSHIYNSKSDDKTYKDQHDLGYITYIYNEINPVGQRYYIPYVNVYVRFYTTITL